VTHGRAVGPADKIIGSRSATSRRRRRNGWRMHWSVPSQAGAPTRQHWTISRSPARSPIRQRRRRDRSCRI